MTGYEKITKVQIRRERKYTAPEPWKFDVEMEIGPERLAYQVIKTIKKDCPVNKDRKILERWDIILGVEDKITIGRRPKEVKQMIRATKLTCNLILLRPNLYTMGEKEPFKFRTLCLETLRKCAPIVLVVEMTKRHNCEWPSYGFETFKVCEHDGPKRFFRADIVRHVFNVNIIGRMDKAEQIELIRNDLWEIFRKHGTVKGELLPAEVVETPKQPLWNQIYMGDVLLKLNDFLLFDNEDFVNLRIEIKEKVALTILPLSPMRSFLRTE
ncbi:uncharacterized protein LOC111259537 [Varroa jacobsoni]|uniref:Uncharacterized protein n=1 Tax=Varroa destructor TaxID=109461 RepID=A0A7M7KXE4_VARDE|nr:uncharacterized protein LOC111254136 [Varroa destructor]XP_022687363.1 uncharacterized protein LOC111259537 [Varroa jacobsoni]